MDSTKRVVKAMLCENTGSHFLDSGFAYGRNWTRNQGRKFETEPATVLEITEGEISVTHNLYHFLLESVTYNPKLTKRFSDWARRQPANKGWLDLAKVWAERQWNKYYNDSESDGHPGIGGQPAVVNTYNSDDALSQTIQYVLYEDAYGQHILLQIHGGCDVRGGYTRPRVFDVSEDDYPSIFDNAKVGLLCLNENCQSLWYSDDAGYGFHFQGNYSEDSKCFEQYERVSTEDFELISSSMNGNDKPLSAGKVVIDEHGKPHCPICGIGEIVAGY